MPSRIVLSDWIYYFCGENLFGPHEQSDLQIEIIEKVQDAIAKLTDKERKFVEMYWYDGRTIAELSVLLDKTPYNLRSLKDRIIRKLRFCLSQYAAERFRIEETKNLYCVICNHPRKPEIDELLRTKKPEQTFKPIINVLKRSFNLRITTPQILISHMKYHIEPEDNYAK